MIDTSDEMLNVNFQELNFIARHIVDSNDHRQPNRGNRECNRTESIGRRSQSPRRYQQSAPPHALTPEEKVDRLICEAEAVKARILPATGKDKNPHKLDSYQDSHSVFMDEGFLVVGGHVDPLMVEKIQRGDYVDFGKLIPRDQVLVEEEQRLEMVIKGGHTYYMPVSESSSINSFLHWEQAFRVFANIYTKTHPERSSELIEYNHIIHTISLSYTWDNVYMYDKDFRMHLARHPKRSWSVILQQS